MTPLAPVVAFPLRVRQVARHNARELRSSLSWLVNSREHTNFTFDLHPRNLRHLEWFLSEVTGCRNSEIRGWMEELAADLELVDHIERTTAASPRHRLADTKVRYGSRVAWYVLVRALKPALTAESGVDKGLGSCVIAAALRRNGAEGHPGHHMALDRNPDAGYLIKPPYSDVVSLVLGDALKTISTLPTGVGLFLHECRYTAEFETAQFRLVESKLSDRAMLLTDNAMKTDALVDYAESTGRRFLFFREVPNHWSRGGGVGIAWKPVARFPSA